MPHSAIAYRYSHQQGNVAQHLHCNRALHVAFCDFEEIIWRALGSFLTVTYRKWHGVQSLTQNELREKVILRADGGMRSGKDVMLAAALGADEYGFGTVAMIATGCIMARVCHTNNCPVGVASQREELRARFPGAPADLVSLPPST